MWIPFVDPPLSTPSSLANDPSPLLLLLSPLPTCHAQQFCNMGQPQSDSFGSCYTSRCCCCCGRKRRRQMANILSCHTPSSSPGLTHTHAHTLTHSGTCIILNNVHTNRLNTGPKLIRYARQRERDTQRKRVSASKIGKRESESESQPETAIKKQRSSAHVECQPDNCYKKVATTKWVSCLPVSCKCVRAFLLPTRVCVFVYVCICFCPKIYDWHQKKKQTATQEE